MSLPSLNCQWWKVILVQGGKLIQEYTVSLTIPGLPMGERDILVQHGKVIQEDYPRIECYTHGKLSKYTVYLRPFMDWPSVETLSKNKLYR